MKTRQRGLTLIELMVTLAVAIILLAIGIPAYRGMEANNRAAALANSLVSAVTLARTEAMSQGMPVSVCSRSAPDAATCGTSGDWVNGWLVFTDADTANVGTYEKNTETIVRGFDAPRRSPTITASTGFVRFGSEGVQKLGAGSVPGTVTMLLSVADAASSHTRCLTISPVGQVRVERKTACP